MVIKKWLLVLIAVILWSIAAILTLVDDSLGSQTAGDFLIYGVPFFAASFMDRFTG